MFSCNTVWSVEHFRNAFCYFNAQIQMKSVSVLLFISCKNCSEIYPNNTVFPYRYSCGVKFAILLNLE